MNSFSEKKQDIVADSIVGDCFSVIYTRVAGTCLLVKTTEIINNLQFMKNSYFFDRNNHKNTTWEISLVFNSKRTTYCLEYYIYRSWATSVIMILIRSLISLSHLKMSYV